MDKIKTTFDEWAKNGRDELMEKEHGTNVKKFLNKISFEIPFTFLDVGCGNGWVVRMIAQNTNCKKVVGIDKSKNMIVNAKKNKMNSKESYFVADIENWKYKGKFDIVFSMESLYYSKSIPKALEKIYRLLNSNGRFFCGTDFYSDNKATSHWSDRLQIPMHLHSKKEWKNFFADAGFKVKTLQIKDYKDKRKWKREMGTLFIIGTK